MYGPRIAVLIFALLLLAYARAENSIIAVERGNHAVLLQPWEHSAGTNLTPGRHRQGHTSHKTGAALAVAVAAFTALFLILKCWQLIISSFEWTGSAEKRSLAVGGADGGKCVAETPSASSILGLLQLSDAEAEGLNSQQKSVVANAKGQAVSAFSKLKSLTTEESSARNGYMDAREKFLALEAKDPNSAATFAAKQHYAAQRQHHTKIKFELDALTQRLSSWYVGPHLHARMLTLGGRTHQAGRNVSSKMLGAVCLAEVIMGIAPPTSASVPAAFLQPVKKWINSRLETVSGRQAALMVTPRPADFQDQVDQVVKDYRDIALMAEMLSTAGLEDLLQAVKARLGTLEATVVSSAGTSMKDLIAKLEELDIEEVQHPGDAQDETQAGKSDGEKPTPADAVTIVTARMQDWCNRVTILFDKAEQEEADILQDLELLLEEGLNLSSQALATKVSPPTSAQLESQFKAQIEQCKEKLKQGVDAVFPLWAEVTNMHMTSISRRLQELQTRLGQLPPGEVVGASSPMMALLQNCSDIMVRVNDFRARMNSFGSVLTLPRPLSEILLELETVYSKLKAEFETAAKEITRCWKTHLLKLRDGVKAGEIPQAHLEQARKDAAIAAQILKGFSTTLSGSPSGP